jgi:MFS family permease
MPERFARLVALLLLGSGFSALVYQIVWTRQFRLIFGSSTAATAAVLAIFTLGLGLGAYLVGPRLDRSQRPLRAYAAIEAGVAVSAAASPFLLAVVRWGYLSLGGTVTLGAAAGTLLRLLLAAIVLAVPTFLMGATLPAAARAVTAEADDARRGVAWLYGFNTLGSVAGAALAALDRHHRSPWVSVAVFSRFLGLLPEIARAQPGAAAPIRASLAIPFAGGSLYEERLTLLLRMSTEQGDCRPALAYFERAAPPDAEYRALRERCLGRSSPRPAGTH